MTDHDKCEAWKDKLRAEIRDKAPAFGSGKALETDGDFENVAFHIGAAYGETGKNGGMLVAIAITDQNSTGNRKQVQVEGNWRTDTPAKVARDAVEKYVNLKQRYP